MRLKYFLIIATTVLSFFGFRAIAQSVGNATYYGNKFHGKRTSDGSRYHKDSLTCAHRTLPFGTYLKVRNPRNGREVVVKVTDRGPFRKGAIVDLSMAAAKAIDVVRAGVARVEVTTVGSAPANLMRPQENVLPELQLLDPATGNYYTASQWAEREQNEMERAKVRRAQKRNAQYMAKNKRKEPRWTILNKKMTAKGILGRNFKSMKQ